MKVVNEDKAEINGIKTMKLKSNKPSIKQKDFL